MVIIYIQISMNLKLKIIKPMACKSIKHMVKKSDACIDIRTSGSVNIQFQLDLSFFCISLNGCFSCHYSFSLSSSSKRTAMELA